MAAGGPARPARALCARAGGGGLGLRRVPGVTARRSRGVPDQEGIPPRWRETSNRVGAGAPRELFLLRQRREGGGIDFPFLSSQARCNPFWLPGPRQLFLEPFMRQLEKRAFHSPLCLDSPLLLVAALGAPSQALSLAGFAFSRGPVPALFFGPAWLTHAETLFTANLVPLAPGSAEEKSGWEAGRSLNLHDRCRLPLLVCGHCLHPGSPSPATNGREQCRSLSPV